MEKARYSNKQLGEASKHKYYYEHILQYVLLAIAFILALTLLFQLKDFLLKLVTIILISLVYFVWGIWHHWEEQNLSRTHVFEYLVVSILIFAVLVFVFLNN